MAKGRKRKGGGGGRRRIKITGTSLGHELEIEWEGHMLVAGPTRVEEEKQRRRLEQQIYTWLRDACPDYFGHENNTICDTVSKQIAHEVDENGDPVVKFVRAKNALFYVKDLYVNYRNRKHWKQWIRIVDNIDRGSPGSPAWR